MCLLLSVGNGRFSEKGRGDIFHEKVIFPTGRNYVLPASINIFVCDFIDWSIPLTSGRRGADLICWYHRVTAGGYRVLVFSGLFGEAGGWAVDFFKRLSDI